MTERATSPSNAKARRPTRPSPTQTSTSSLVREDFWPSATRKSQGNVTVRGSELDEAFHAVFTEMPPGWHFKGLALSTRARNARPPGWWFASASGPDPLRDGHPFGISGYGRPGYAGMAEALGDLAEQLAEIREDALNTKEL
jgi:hypothetical protein